jgi:hypothetical protein
MVHRAKPGRNEPRARHCLHWNRYFSPFLVRRKSTPAVGSAAPPVSTHAGESPPHEQLELLPRHPVEDIGIVRPHDGLRQLLAIPLAPRREARTRQTDWRQQVLADARERLQYVFVIAPPIWPGCATTKDWSTSWCSST